RTSGRLPCRAGDVDRRQSDAGAGASRHELPDGSHRRELGARIRPAEGRDGHMPDRRPDHAHGRADRAVRMVLRARPPAGPAPPRSHRPASHSGAAPQDCAESVTWAATILTLYPEMFPGPLGLSLAGRALADGIWSLETVQIRDFATDRHKSVDDTPAGGGAGMVMRADVVAAALDSVPDGRPKLVMSPRGRPLS